MPHTVRKARQSVRYPVWITATCRSSLGRVADVILSDLSAEGCGIKTPEGLLKPGQSVIVRMQALEAMAGTVCWVKGQKAGVRFDRPLYGPVLEHLVRVQLSAPDNSNVSPLRPDSSPKRLV